MRLKPKKVVGFIKVISMGVRIKDFDWLLQNAKFEFSGSINSVCYTKKHK